MFKKFLMIVLGVLFFSTSSFAAESVSFSMGSKNWFTGRSVLTITYETAVDGSLATATRISTDSYVGSILKVKHVPGVSALSTGVADVTLEDSDGMDLMGGAMGNIDTSDSFGYTPLVGGAYQHNPIDEATTITLEIASNSQASATGIIEITFGR